MIWAACATRLPLFRHKPPQHNADTPYGKNDTNTVYDYFHNSSKGRDFFNMASAVACPNLKHIAVHAQKNDQYKKSTNSVIYSSARRFHASMALLLLNFQGPSAIQISHQLAYSPLLPTRVVRIKIPPQNGHGFNLFFILHHLAHPATGLPVLIHVVNATRANTTTDYYAGKRCQAANNKHHCQ